jgi:hypothetical protein
MIHLGDLHDGPASRNLKAAVPHQQAGNGAVGVGSG